MRRIVAGAVAALIIPAAVPAQTREEVGFALELFEGLQAISFAKRREYCGYIGRDGEGLLIATEPVPGNRDSCAPEWPHGLEVIASYHTHGAFDFAYHNELPSDTDMLNVRALGVNGWIATPGGRLWHVDSERMVAKQVCGVGCLPVAPNFYKSQAGDIAKVYTFDELLERLSR